MSVFDTAADGGIAGDLIGRDLIASDLTGRDLTGSDRIGDGLIGSGGTASDGIGRRGPEPAPDRRGFLKTMVAGGTAFAALASAGGHVALADSRPRPIVTRRDIGAMSERDDTVKIYKDGVRIMKERSQRNPLDPLGWQMQGATHAIFCSDANIDLQVHYGWYFLPWHRGYLWTLEEKIRRLTGEASFALPYWDWTRRPRIPSVFFGPDNPMEDGTRLYGPYDIIPADFLDLRGIVEAPVFHNFGGFDSTRGNAPKIEGILENSCHNNVHNWIGGNMASFSGAGFDPIFYTHHNMIDRVWEVWKARDPLRNTDPVDESFLDYEFRFFGASGDVERYAVRDLLDARRLGYGFDRLDVAYTLAERDDPRFNGGIDPTMVAELDLSDDLWAGVKAIGDGGQGRRVLLQFERVQVPLHPLCIRIFLNNPDATAASPAAGPTFAGTFTLLPIGTDGRGLEPVVSMQLDVSRQIGALIKSGRKITVSAVPVPLRGRAIPDQPLRLRGVSLTVDV